MNLSKEHGEFLARYQSLVFNSKLQTGTPREKADALRSTLAQLQYANLSGIIEDDTASGMARHYGDMYSGIVDSFDERTGLNNYADGALNLCSGSKNDSKNWKSCLTMDNLKAMPCVQKLLTENKKLDEKLLPSSKKQQPVPTTDNKEENKQAWNVNKPRNNLQPESVRASLDQPRNTDQSRDGIPSRATDQSRYADQSRNGIQPKAADQSRDSVLSLYGNQSRHQTARVREDRVPDVSNRSDGFDNGTRSRPLNNNPLFSGGDKTVPWSDHQRGSKHEREPLKRQFQQTYDDNEDGESYLPSRGSNAFRTARQQLDIDKQKKFGGGGGGGQNRAPVQPAFYGTGKKSLGTRRGLSSKFVPPIANREDEDNGNQAATTITRAVLKTGGGGTSGKGEGPEMEGPLKGIEPKMIELIMNEIMDNGPQLTWDDVAGLEFAKKTIKEIVVWPMLRPDIFTGLRGPPKGLLLFGPPGTGKTLIGKCIASQSKSTFFCISASSLTSKWVGEGEKMVRALFGVSRAHQPAVVFIDEIDSLLTQRTDGENEASRRIKTEFLVQLDGASTNSDDRLLVIGATNRPQEIDEAARRRFVKRLYIPLPEQEARRTIVTNLLRQQSYKLDLNELDHICTHTHGFSGADMATLCREAALGPIRDMSFGDIEHIAADQVRPISFQDFRDALENVRPSVSERDLDLYLDWNKTYGSGSR